MGIADRDYHRTDHRNGSGFLSQIPPVVKALLIANLAIYFLDLVLASPAGSRPLRDFGVFSIHSAVTEFKIWKFLTFQFLHGSVGHVAFNCLGLYFFGPFMERWWGSRNFLIFYLVCGIAGALFFTLLVVTHVLPGDNIHSSLVGASAGIYGILIGVAVIAPSLRVRLLIPPIELTMRQLALALFAVSAGSILLKFGGNEGGEAGHLGGSLVGLILVKFPWLIGANPNHLEVRKPPHSVEPKIRPRSDLEAHRDTAVDAILDKISREGFQSLTQEEREFLQKASTSSQDERR